MAELRRPAALASLTASTLLAEVALTRTMSIAYFPHVAFLVLSTAMLGTGVAAAVQSLRTIADDLPSLRTSAHLASGTGAALLVGHALVHAIGAEPLAVSGSPVEVVRLGAALAALTLPFFASGAAVTRLLAARRADSFRMYAADLGGAASGCALAVPAMNGLGPRGALLLASALAVGAGSLLYRSPARYAAGAVAGALFLASPWGTALLPLHVSDAKVTRAGQPFDRVLLDSRTTTASVETAHPRLDRVEFTPAIHRLMFDAGVAAVRIPRSPATPPHDATLTYELRPDSPVAIIGAGAGWEVQEALHFTQAEIDAVEIHPEVHRFVPPRLRTNDRVNWHIEDGRTFLERTDQRYGSIVMIHTISNAASAAGALHLSESYLLTVEAATALRSRLLRDGLLLVTRPEAQIGRWVATLRAAVSEPIADRVVVWREPSRGPSFYGAVLYAEGGWTGPDLETVRRRIARRGLELLHAPGAPADSAREPRLAHALGLGPEPPGRNRIDPVTDDRPFFNQRIAFSDLKPSDFVQAFGAEDRARAALEDTPFAETSAVIVLVEVGLIGAFAILLPFSIRRDEPGSVRPGHGPVASHLAFYPALGLGFMLTEIALVQQLGLLSGTPTRTLAIVLGGLLLGGGVGARWAQRARRPDVRIAVVALAVAAWAGVGGALVHAAVGAFLALRTAVAAGIAFSLGLALGQPFPLGLHRSGQLGTRWAAWGFALNAVASVGATVLALILATELGFRGVLLVATAAYAAAALAVRRLVPPL